MIDRKQITEAYQESKKYLWKTNWDCPWCGLNNRIATTMCLNCEYTVGFFKWIVTLSPLWMKILAVFYVVMAGAAILALIRGCCP